MRHIQDLLYKLGDMEISISYSMDRFVYGLAEDKAECAWFIYDEEEDGVLVTFDFDKFSDMSELSAYVETIW